VFLAATVTLVLLLMARSPAFILVHGDGPGTAVLYLPAPWCVALLRLRQVELNQSWLCICHSVRLGSQLYQSRPVASWGFAPLTYGGVKRPIFFPRGSEAMRLAG